MSTPTYVTLETVLGCFTVELHGEQAPLSTANFLAYVDSGRYDGSSFFRIVSPSNQQPEDPVRISVIHGGTRPLDPNNFPMIELESTLQTGLTHRHGTLSLGRDGPNSAEGDFFICLGDQPHFDHGGARHLDGLGFAVFGQVCTGMEVVEAIWACAGEQEYLPPEGEIAIVRAYRQQRGV
ncbi:peptidylprolyl isomerase [Pseudomonas germanica]|uniref:peptidylprolyl isomerase n=1 Tax=Pseudomonas germanica TaxID=2815720 RepID=A0ABX8YLA9_9PSED|nr:peptidylprolyl isomerase [Pseudomonas germanica]QYY80553.1 peptidylprolyl isomerase [Pseudomonas germanica]